MGRGYQILFENVAVSAAQDLFMVAPADDKPVMLRGFTLANVGGIADAGDAQEEDLRLLVARGYATVGSGGTSVTPTPVDSGNAQASGATCRVNDTTVAVVGGGSIVNLGAHGWNTRVEYQMFYMDEIAPRFREATDTRLVVRLVAAPNDSFQVSGTLWFEEIV